MLKRRKINNKNIRLFECCILIKGYKRSVILDTQRYTIDFVPNDLLEIIKKGKKKTIFDIMSKMDYKDREIYQEYIDFLIEKEYAFFIDKSEISFFPPLSLKWDSPNIISNAIICYNAQFQYFDILSQLDSLLCSSIHFLFFEDILFDNLNNFLLLIDNFTFQSIELLLNYNNSFTIEKLYSLFKYKQIKKITFFSETNIDLKEDKIKVISGEKLTTYNSCGGISKKMFTLNLPFFTESQLHNTCLNRKLCIDYEGNIKNCPAMEQSYGKFKDTTLKEAIEKPGFKDLWFIHKEQIDVCKDCEFRHICTDCRCFIKDPENIYSQPAKCSYNPYICKWEDQDNYIPVEECGTYSKETGFMPDKKKIETLNKQIWGEEDE